MLSLKQIFTKRNDMGKNMYQIQKFGSKKNNILNLSFKYLGSEILLKLILSTLRITFGL